MVFILMSSYSLERYEGTGRSLSLKLLQQLESQSQMSTQSLEGTHSGKSFFFLKTQFRLYSEFVFFCLDASIGVSLQT